VAEFTGNNIMVKYAEFNDQANEILLALFHEFMRRTESLSRAGNENVFQLQKAQYADMLRQQLEASAATIISGCASPTMHEQLQFGLRAKIGFYVSEFLQKVEEL
jgi:hypothetical protein